MSAGVARTTLLQHFSRPTIYDAWSIKNAFMGPILIGDLRLLTYKYTVTFVFELQKKKERDSMCGCVQFHSQ